MQGAWAAFARDPWNGLSAYKGGWPAYDVNGERETLVRLAWEGHVGANLAVPGLYDQGCGNASLVALEVGLGL